jgi:biotin carboxyl carrier protein
MTLNLQIGGRSRRVELPQDLVTALGSGVAIAGPQPCTVDGETIQVDVHLFTPGVLSLIVDGRSYRCILDEGPVERAVLMQGHRLVYALEDPRSLRSQRGASANDGRPRPIKSPMPGRVASILVAVGDSVAEQQGILMLEAMKMQNEMKAPKEGIVISIDVAMGDTVKAGQVLAVIGTPESVV